MKFPYVRYGIFYRPVIPITLSYKGNNFPYEALVDTGADISILPAAIADQLDIDLRSGKEFEFGGIVGSNSGYLHNVGVNIGSHQMDEVPVIFSDNIAPDGYGILGHEGFFTKFKLIIEAGKRTIEIVPKKYR